ncbi:MAG: TraR/DksA family transcriptional regulator [Desulfobacterales bacterium]
MEKDELQEFELLLKDELKELARKAGLTVSDLLESSVQANDPLDLVSMDNDRAVMLRMRDRESKLIRKIEEALERIKDGTYGICEMCGEDIAPARLRARPVTTFCIQCKTRMESAERARV